MTPPATSILVVDDDPALLEALPEMLRLRMPGALVETAGSGAGALERMASVDYDAIITDIKMPGIDGLALLERIRELRPNTPTLVITGHGEHDLAIQALRGGAFDYVLKPIDREYFLASLRRAVQVRGLRRQVLEQQSALERHAAALEQRVEARTRELRLTADRLRVLSESAATIHSARDVEHILHSVADAARRLSDAGVAIAGCSRQRGASEARAGDWVTAAVPAAAARRIGDPQIATLLAACANQNGNGPEGTASAFDPHLSWTLAVPIRPRDGEVRGGIVVGRHEAPPWAADLRMQVGALARQAAVALENALLYQREHHIAETLQRSLLPGELPQIPGVAVDARYLPGRHEAVGGDWYDAFTLPSGQVGMAMGDVAGRGVWAAAVMGQLRSALRAFALEGDPPAHVASRLNRFIPPGTMATLLYLVFDPAAMEVRYVNMGHLPPLLVAPRAAPAFLEGGGPPLGVKRWYCYQEETVPFTPGSTIVLYTDGLVETRNTPIDDGLTRLSQAVAAKAAGEITGLLDHVLAHVPRGSEAEDDIAILALRALAVGAEQLSLTLPAIPSSLGQLRQMLRRWLCTVGVPSDVAQEITVACNEASANVIEHAYGPGDATVFIEAHRTDDGVAVTVRDTGRWHAPDPGHRGLGLSVMRALMDDVDMAIGPEGTTVRMQRRVPVRSMP